MPKEEASFRKKSAEARRAEADFFLKLADAAGIFTVMFFMKRIILWAITRFSLHVIGQ
jgi:hypothetical protein